MQLSTAKNYVLGLLNADQLELPLKKYATWDDRRFKVRGLWYIEYNGVTKTLTEWGQHLGINRGTLSARLRRGWNVDDAFSTPVRQRKSIKQNLSRAA